jgi:hypothetical protein
MDARTPRIHLTAHTHLTRPNPQTPVVTQRHHTEHLRTHAECLRGYVAANVFPSKNECSFLYRS